MVKILSKLSIDCLSVAESTSEKMVNIVWSYGKAQKIAPCPEGEVSCPMCGRSEGYIFKSSKDKDYVAWTCKEIKCAAVNANRCKKFSTFPRRLEPTSQLAKPAFSSQDIGLPYGMDKASISKLTPSVGMTSVVRDIMSGVYGNSFFYGPPGTGKTYLACAIINLWIESSNKPAIFMSWDGITESWLREYQESSTDSLKYKLSRIPLLVIDDICSKDVTDKFLSWFQSVTGERFDRNLPTICTGNFSPGEIGAKLSAPILSRMGLVPVSVQGIDRRDA